MFLGRTWKGVPTWKEGTGQRRRDGYGVKLICRPPEGGVVQLDCGKVSEAGGVKIPAGAASVVASTKQLDSVAGPPLQHRVLLCTAQR